MCREHEMSIVLLVKTNKKSSQIGSGAVVLKVIHLEYKRNVINVVRLY